MPHPGARLRRLAEDHGRLVGRSVVHEDQLLGRPDPDQNGLQPARVSPILWKLRAEGGEGLVLTYPFGGFSGSALPMFVQTIHQKPIHWGWTARLPVPRAGAPPLGPRTLPGPPRPGDPLGTELGQIMPFVEHEDVRYILIMRRTGRFAPEFLRRVEAALSRRFSLVHEDEAVALFDVRQHAHR